MSTDLVMKRNKDRERPIMSTNRVPERHYLRPNEYKLSIPFLMHLKQVGLPQRLNIKNLRISDRKHLVGDGVHGVVTVAHVMLCYSLRMVKACPVFVHMDKEQKHPFEGIGIAGLFRTTDYCDLGANNYYGAITDVAETLCFEVFDSLFNYACDRDFRCYVPVKILYNCATNFDARKLVSKKKARKLGRGGSLFKCKNYAEFLKLSLAQIQAIAMELEDPTAHTFFLQFYHNDVYTPHFVPFSSFADLFHFVRPEVLTAKNLHPSLHGSIKKVGKKAHEEVYYMYPPGCDATSANIRYCVKTLVDEGGQGVAKQQCTLQALEDNDSGSRGDFAPMAPPSAIPIKKNVKKDKTTVDKSTAEAYRDLNMKLVRRLSDMQEENKKNKDDMKGLVAEMEEMQGKMVSENVRVSSLVLLQRNINDARDEELVLKEKRLNAREVKIVEMEKLTSKSASMRAKMKAELKAEMKNREQFLAAQIEKKLRGEFHRREMNIANTRMSLFRTQRRDLQNKIRTLQMQLRAKKSTLGGEAAKEATRGEDVKAPRLAPKVEVKASIVPENHSARRLKKAREYRGIIRGLKTDLSVKNATIASLEADIRKLRVSRKDEKRALQRENEELSHFISMQM